jgi:signal transduction histidine kinase
MSHELRTPLNAIIGFSDMLLSAPAGATSDKLAGYVKDINRAGWHLLGVVNDILDLAKIDAGKLELSESDVDFGGLLESCLAMIRGRCDDKRLTLECDSSGGLPRLRVDELKLKQVLLNLLSNAAKFTPAGGRVRVTTARDGQCFVIAVADTGVGIAREDLPKVLVPFTQLESKVARKHEGTGLGLPLSKGLVELHGGSLAIESEPGVGTTATVRLPVERVIELGAGAVGAGQDAIVGA